MGALRDREGGGGVPQVVEGRRGGVMPALLDGRRPDAPAEVRSAEGPTLRRREDEVRARYRAR